MRRVTVQLLAATMLVVTAWPATAQQSPSPPISVKPARLSGPGPFTVSVDNQTGVALTVKPAFSGVDGSPTPNPLSLLGGAKGTITVTLPPPPATTPAGAELVLTVDPGGPLPAGWVTRLPIEAGGTKQPAVPAVSKWRAASYGGFSWWMDPLRSETISLKNTGTCNDVDLEPEQRVGTLQAEGRSVAVRATCMVREGGGLAAELSFSDLSINGADYTGTIDLAPADEKAGTVDLTLRRTTRAGNVVVLLGAGLLIALLMNWWTATGRAATNDLLRVEALRWAIHPRNTKSAIKQFQKIIRTGSLTGPVATWDLETALTKELDAAGKDLRLVRRFGRSDADKLKKAQQRLDSVEAAIAAWPSLANRLVELDRAKAGFESLDRFAADILTSTLDRPNTKIAVADVGKIRETADLAIGVAGWWIEDRIAPTRKRLRDLQNVNQGSANFKTARNAAIDAWNRFDEQRRNVLTVAEIRDAMTSFEEASARITTAWDIKLLGAQAASRVREMESVSVGAGPGRGFHKDEPVDDPFQTTFRLKAERWLADAAVVIILLVVALVGGAKALYVDKAVGGPWDYIEITAWALGSAVVVPPIAAAIERYFRRQPLEGAQQTS